MNSKHNRFKRQSPSLTKRSERSPSGQQKCFCQSSPLYVFQLYVCSSYQEISMKCISSELNLELVTATVRVQRYCVHCRADSYSFPTLTSEAKSKRHFAEEIEMSIPSHTPQHKYGSFSPSAPKKPQNVNFMFER